jgi:hypothetical protein
MENRIQIVSENKILERSFYMRKNLSVLFIGLMVLTTCSFAAGKHGAEIKQLRADQKNTQKAENISFRESLQGKSQEEKAALIAAHRATQQQENQEFKAQMEAKKAQWKADKDARQAAREAKLAEKAAKLATANSTVIK